MNTQASPAAPSLTPERLIQLGRVTAAAPSPDGTWLAVCVTRLDAQGAKYVGDLWRVAADGSEVPRQLTRSDSDDRDPAFRADGSLGFLSNRNPRPTRPEDGDEDRFQVWLLPAGGGEPVPLTDEPLGVRSFAFAAEGDRLVAVLDLLPGVPEPEQRRRAAERKKHGPSMLVYRAQPTRHWDQWIGPAVQCLAAYDGNGGSRRLLTPAACGEFRGAELDVSNDGRRLVTTQRAPGPDRVEDVGLLLVDLDSGTQRLLVREERVEYSTPRFSPDGATVACLRSERRTDCVGKPALRLIATGTGAVSRLAEGWDAWPRPQCWTRDGNALLATADVAGTVPLFRVDVSSGAVERISAPEAGGCHEGVRALPGGAAAVGVRHRLTHPPEPFRIPLLPGAQPELLASLSGFTPEEGSALLSLESRSTVADDGAAVQYFVARPAAASEPLPLLLWIHGGPVSQWTDGWTWRWSAATAVAAGYTVALPNPRGSTGAGQSFLEGIWNAWGEQCYRDLMAVADALAADPQVDAGRMAAMGGSFGGYMTNWIGGQTDRFRCLVTHASLYHFPAFHGETDIPVWFAAHTGTTPWEDAAAFERCSPHRLVGGWKSPVLILHGERDYRVPIGEGLALFEALQHHGVECELVAFPDEGHWIVKPRNSLAWYGAVLEFLRRHLAA